MYDLTESVSLSKIKKPSYTILLFEVLLCLAAFPFLRAESTNTTILPDDPDLKPSEKGKVCYTPECIRTATRVLNYMNSSLDPCDNFYKFACGKFITTNLKNGVNSVSQSSLIKNNIQGQMMDYLQNKTLSTLPRYVRLIKTFYNSCTDVSIYNKEKERTLNSIMELINQTNGWPLLKNGSWEDKNFQWEKFFFQTKDVNSLRASFINPYPSILILGNDNIPLRTINQPKKFVTSQELYNNLLSFGQLIGIEKSYVENSLQRMIEVNNKLNGIYKLYNDDDFSSNEMTVNELVQKYPNILWKEFFNTIGKPYIIDDDNVIFVNEISYFEKLNNLIPTISKRDQANYLLWRIIDKILAPYLKLLKTKNNRSQECYDIMFEKFNYAVEFFYVKNNFNNDLFAKETDEMIHNIREEYITLLKNSSWLDTETKMKALETLESIIIESPSKYSSYDNEIDEYYKSLEITPGDYFQSLLNITEFNFKQDLNALLNQDLGNKKSWKHLEKATEVNAQYSYQKNAITLMPVLFQRVYFNEERPKYMNYGSMGSTIAHEMSHAFESEGRNYRKKEGRVNWWSPEANATFLRKVQCIINQHNHYRAEEIGLNMNGNQTKRENIADFVGLEVAYSAYVKYMETHDSEPLLPDVNYTQRQLFWISYAQIECSIETPEILKSIVEHDEHSIPKYRVIGPLSNSLNFARDFQCEPNTKMNPVDKCTFW